MSVIGWPGIRAPDGRREGEAHRVPEIHADRAVTKVRDGLLDGGPASRGPSSCAGRRCSVIDSVPRPRRCRSRSALRMKSTVESASSAVSLVSAQNASTLRADVVRRSTRRRRARSSTASCRRSPSPIWCASGCAARNDVAARLGARIVGPARRQRREDAPRARRRTPRAAPSPACVMITRGVRQLKPALFAIIVATCLAW